MAYQKEVLLKNLLSFEEENGHYPTHQDWEDKSITPSKGVYYRTFGSMEEAIRQAELYKRGELVIEDRKRNRSTDFPEKQKRVRCLTCGQYVRNIGEYFDTLPKILSGRFINLLNSNNGQTYFDGVMDSIHAVFGTKNPVIRTHLELVGYLEKYEEKYNQKQGEEN